MAGNPVSDLTFLNIPAINLGLRLAAEIGLGLPLFNALRREFPGTPLNIVGALARVVGGLIRGGQQATGDALEQLPNLADLQLVPADFHPGEPGDRVLARVDVTWTDPLTGEKQFRQKYINAPETYILGELVAAAVDEVLQDEKDYDEDIAKLISDMEGSLYFLGKRY